MGSVSSWITDDMYKAPVEIRTPEVDDRLTGNRQLRLSKTWDREVLAHHMADSKSHVIRAQHLTRRHRAIVCSTILLLTVPINAQQPAQSQTQQTPPAKKRSWFDRVKEETKKAWEEAQKEAQKEREPAAASAPTNPRPQTVPKSTTPVQPSQLPPPRPIAQPDNSQAEKAQAITDLLHYIDVPEQPVPSCPRGLPPLPKPEDLRNCNLKENEQRCQAGIIALMAHNRLADASHLFDPAERFQGNHAAAYQITWNQKTASGFVALRYGGMYVEANNYLFYTYAVFRPDGLIKHINFHEVYQGNEYLNSPPKITDIAQRFIHAWKTRDRVALESMIQLEGHPAFGNSFGARESLVGPIERCFLPQGNALANNRGQFVTKITCLSRERSFQADLYLDASLEKVVLWGLLVSPNAGSTGFCKAIVHPCDNPDLSTSYDRRNDNYHYYPETPQPVVICRTSQPGCTRKNVFRLMLQNPTTVAPVTSTPQIVTNCGQLELVTAPFNLLGYKNFIQTVIDYTEHSVTNYALPGHMFYPGHVKRQIVDRHNGTIEVETTGEGTGDFRWLNVKGGQEVIWPLANEQLRVEVINQ